MLTATNDPFGGVIIEVPSLPERCEDFREELDESIAAWRAAGVKVAWLQLPVERADLVPIAVSAGFGYHHATQEWLQLTIRLVEGAYVPQFATHYIGAGGVVLTEDRRLLVIQERHHARRHFKLPGGALQPGEHIVDAVIREVKEETNVDTEFISLVCFRHWHGYRHGKSDIYFVTRLRPLSYEIVPDPNEIAMCVWMPVDEYLTSPDTHVFNRRIVQAALDLETEGSHILRPESIPDYGTPQTHELFFPRQG